MGIEQNQIRYVGMCQVQSEGAKSSVNESPLGAKREHGLHHPHVGFVVFDVKSRQKSCGSSVRHQRISDVREEFV